MTEDLGFEIIKVMQRHIKEGNVSALEAIGTLESVKAFFFGQASNKMLQKKLESGR